MRACLGLIMLLGLSGPGLGQQICAPDAVGDVPPCMVGTWTGENDMAERMDQMFAMLPDNVWASGRPESGRFLFLRVEADGSFITSPLLAAADASILSDEGFIGNLRASLVAGGGTGLFVAPPGETLTFCTRTGGWGIASLEGEGGGAADVAIISGDSGFVPAMRYACSGNRLQIFIDLPPPMGTVTYDLTRIPDADIPPVFEEIFAE